jgi:hypothetical protein
MKNGCLHQARYQFGEGGALYQLSRVDRGRGEADCGPLAVVRREPCVSGDAAMAAFSALLAEFERLRLAITYDAAKGVQDHLAIVLGEAKTLVESLRHPYARIIGHLVSPAAEAINDMLVIRIEDVLKILHAAEHEKPKIELMETLSFCFNFLFGVSAMDAVTAFSRFGSAFFNVVGCPTKPGNVKSQFYMWQRPKEN